MARSKKSQSAHNSTVKNLQSNTDKKVIRSKPDIEGWKKPDTIKGVRPDIIAEKKGHKTVVEVETQDSVQTKRDIQQQRVFKNWSKNSNTKHYKRIVTEE